MHRDAPRCRRGARAGACERVARLARREHERDPLSQEAVRDEREGARRPAIKPLRVVDDGEERPVFRDFGEQPQDGQSDEKRIGGRPGMHAEGDAERVALEAAGAAPRARGTVSTIAGARRTRAPSRPRLRWFGQRGNRCLRRRRTRATPSCRRPALHARPRRRLSPGAQPRAAGRVRHALACARTGGVPEPERAQALCSASSRQYA